jgi:CRISPR-associated protein Csx17
MDAERFSAPTVPVQAALSVPPYDVVPFLYEETDDQKIEELLWGFTLVARWRDRADDLRARWRGPLSRRPLPRSWALIKLLHMPGRVAGVEMRIEPRIASLLKAGRVGDAVEVAHRRMRVSNLNPIDVRYEEWTQPGRLLAALLIPTERGELESLVFENK